MRHRNKLVLLWPFAFITNISLQHADSLGRQVARPSRLLFLLGIFTISAHAEKPTTPSQWLTCLTSQRNALQQFEVEVETWRLDIRGATSSVTYEQGEALLAWFPGLLSQPDLQESDSDGIVSLLVKEVRNRFGGSLQITEARREIHQRDAEQGYYRVWEKLSGALSIFDRRGIWNQDEHEISIGPPPKDSEIEVYLARLGLLLPSSATAEEIFSATPTQATSEMVFRVDMEGSRFRFGCRPWLGMGLVDSIRETSLWEGKEQGLLEKRVWSQLPPMGPMPKEKPYPFFPLVGVELQYHSDTRVESIAVRRVLSVNLDPNTWSSFPKERPPFGWSVLDYRFKPAVEYRFGFQSP